MKTKNITSKTKNELSEILTWILIILVTFLTVLFLPWYLAQNILQFIVALTGVFAIFWYFRSRHLYLDSQAKSEKILQDQREIRNRQKTIDLIYENSADGIMILDHEQKIESFSPGMEHITGYTKEEALGRDAKSLLRFQGDKNNSLLPDVMFLPKDLLKSPYVTNSLITKDGKEINIEASYTLIHDGKGIHKALAIIRDITYEKAMNERDKEFIAITSHQMNTPLSIMRGYLSIIKNGKAGKISDQQKTYIDEIYNAVKKLISITNNLLSISRIEQDKIKIEKTDVNVVDLFNRLKENISMSEKKPTAELLFNKVDPNLIVYADEEKIYQALFNLIDNSLKYTLEGKVVVDADKKDGMVLLKVSDTGIGINKEDLPKISQKFYRAQNAIDIDNKGTGLGMFIVKTIAEKHHGTLEINSVLNKGTEMTIKLPIKQEAL